MKLPGRIQSCIDELEGINSNAKAKLKKFISDMGETLPEHPSPKEAERIVKGAMKQLKISLFTDDDKDDGAKEEKPKKAEKKEEKKEKVDEAKRLSFKQFLNESELLENFTALEKMPKSDLKHFNVEEPMAGPVLMATYKSVAGKGDVMLVLGVDPDEGKIRVAIDTATKGTTRAKYFDNTADGYKAASKYANSLRTAKVNLSE